MYLCGGVILKVNILIPNIGRRGYLVKYIKEIEEFQGKVFVSDCDKTASGLYTDNDGFFVLSRPVDDEKKYVKELLKLCEKEHIGIIIPVIDPEIYILSKYKYMFEEKSILVMVSCEKVLEICYNKLQMNSFLKENGFAIPKTYSTIEEFENALHKQEIGFPVVIKPVYGSGSVSTYVVNNKEKLYALYEDGNIIQEFIEGEEFGIDVFNNLNKEPVRCVVKKKISMRSGETDKAKTVKDKNIQANVIKLANKLGHIGNLDCDILRKGNEYYFIDLNPRFGGGYPATHEVGVNLLKLVLNMYYEKNISVNFEDYQENILVMKEIAVRTTKL